MVGKYHRCKNLTPSLNNSNNRHLLMAILQQQQQQQQQILLAIAVAATTITAIPQTITVRVGFLLDNSRHLLTIQLTMVISQQEDSNNNHLQSSKVSQHHMIIILERKNLYYHDLENLSNTQVKGQYTRTTTNERKILFLFLMLFLT